MDLYRKSTDRNQYLLTSSCHPPHITSNIPFSLALRIVRSCSHPETRDKRLAELKQLLVDRDYKSKLINDNIEKARKIPRKEALKRVVKKKDNLRPVFVIRYDPRLPSVNNIVKKHWRSMTASDPHMKSIYPQPPLIAYKRPMNLKDYLIRAKIPPQKTRPKRVQNSMFKCNKPCSICPFVRQQKVVKARNNDNKVQLKNHHTCEDKNVVYIVQCKKCNDQYIGETKNSLRSRF